MTTLNENPIQIVEISGLKVKIMPDIKFGRNSCDCCVFDKDVARCAAHDNILGKECYTDDFHFEIEEEQAKKLLHLQNFKIIRIIVVPLSCAKKCLCVVLISDSSYHLSADKQFVINLFAISDGKFVFVKPMGYDSHGRPKNDEMLRKKADKIVSALSEVIQYKVHINKNSLELDTKSALSREPRAYITIAI